MNKPRFLAVILGTDINAYGVARCIYEAYHQKSLCLGIRPLSDTHASKICEVRTREDFETKDTFLETLHALAREFPDIPRILIPCSDGYTALVSRFSEELSKEFLFNIVTAAQAKKLENKKDFYSVCEAYGLPYPDTYIISKDNYTHFKLPKRYPVALKPNDSISYYHLDFPNKKKAYTCESAEELQSVVSTIYHHGYTGELILQDFIPGDCSKMYVLNAYVGKDHSVQMMSLGKCLLDEVLPLNIGNYNALAPMGNQELYDCYKKFLEDISYQGFANFDLKYDERDHQYKVFEINLRQGRSSFYMMAGGLNYIQYLIEDLLATKDQSMQSKAPCHFDFSTGLWLYVDPWVLTHYVSQSDQAQARALLKQGFVFTQWYEKDKSIYRFLMYMRRRLSTIKYYPHYAHADND